MQLTKDKSNLIKTLNFIMTCFMIFYHTGNPDSANAINAIDSGINDYMAHFFDIMCSVVMGYFFSMTGFLLFNNFTFSNYKNKIYKRIFSLLIPYVLWQVIIYAKCLIQGTADFDIIKFLRLTFCFEMFPYDGALWYVYAVFVMALLSPILLLLFRNKKVGLVAIIAIFILNSIKGTISNPYVVSVVTWGYIGNILTYLSAYLIGAFYGKFHDEIDKENTLLYIFILLFVGICIEGRWSYVVVNTLISILPFMIWTQMPALPRLANLKVYNLTFLMYAIHQPLLNDVVYRLFNIASHVHIPVVLINIIIKLIILACVIGIAAIIYNVLRKVCPKLLRLLCGGRE